MRRLVSLFLVVLLMVVLTAPLAMAGTPNEKHLIPFPADYEPLADGASSYDSEGDHFDSPYFTHLDYYNMKSGGTLTMISGFETYQQTTEWSCGPVSALMVLHHYGEDSYKEMDVADMAEGRFKPTSPIDLTRLFTTIGWDWDSSPTGKGDPDAVTFEDPADFTTWMIDHLAAGTPIMLDWIDWGGHWQVAIGYDTMGTESFGDDVLIVADPYDTSDHYQDGYMTYGAERFYYMWRSYDGKDVQPWVIAKPALQ